MPGGAGGWRPAGHRGGSDSRDVRMSDNDAVSGLSAAGTPPRHLDPAEPGVHRVAGGGPRRCAHTGPAGNEPARSRRWPKTICGRVWRTGTVNRVGRASSSRALVSRLAVQRQDQTEWQIEWQTVPARARSALVNACLCSCIGWSATLPGAAEPQSDTW